MTRKERAGTTAGVSLFVVLFLLIFTPFGLDAFGTERRLYLSLGYGFACTLAMAADYFLLMPALPRLFDEEKWTVGRQILWTGWILFTIGVCNSLFSALAGLMPFTPYYLAVSTLQVAVIGLFPVSALVLLDYLRLYRKHARKAETLRREVTRRERSEERSLRLVSDNEKERLSLRSNELLFLTGADNYAAVHFLHNGSRKKKLLRGTLKGFERQLDHPDVVRCHRSYIVNLGRLIDISSNARGYQLTLRDTEEKIPVSKSYEDRVLPRLQER